MDTTTNPAQALTPIFSDFQNMLELVIQKLPVVGIGIICFVVMFWLSRPIAKLLIKPIGYVSKSELIRIVAQRVLSFLIILLGLYIFLRLAGLTQFAIAVVSGTGVAGLIVGFAFKDIAENFISSLLLSVQKPFKIGDVVEVAENLGVIYRVTSRATTLVDFDGNHIQIPNSIIYKNIIKNLSANPKMRSHFVIGIGYDSSIVDSQRIALEIMAENDGVLQEPAPQVLVDNLGSSTVNLKVYFWVNSEKNSVLKVSSVLQRVIMRGFEKANISMPDDARERIFAAPIAFQQVAEKITEEAGAEAQQGTVSAGQLDDKYLDNTAQSEVTKTDNHTVAAGKTDDSALHDIDADIDSDVDDIRKQAQQSRSPEQGENIL